MVAVDENKTQDLNISIWYSVDGTIDTVHTYLEFYIKATKKFGGTNVAVLK